MKFTRDLACDIASMFAKAMHEYPSTVEILVQDKALSYALDGISLDIDLSLDEDALTVLKWSNKTWIEIELRENEKPYFYFQVIGTDCCFYRYVGSYVAALLKPIVESGILPDVKLHSARLVDNAVTVSIVIQFFDRIPWEEDDIVLGAE